MNNLKVGLQLYSVRDKMEKDMDAAFKSIKEIGYDYVEMAGYFNKSSEEIKALLDKYDLKCISVHQGLPFYIEKGLDAVNFVKNLGAKYSTIPNYDMEKFKKDMNKEMELFENIGKLLKDNDIELLYHNHDFEFELLDGNLIIDQIYGRVSKEYLNPEFDTCWIKYAGYDPVEYINKYSDRIKVVHLKDFWCSDKSTNPVYSLIDNNGNEIKTDKTAKKFEFRPIGYGLQDIPGIMNASIKAGAEYVIVEQDNSYDVDTLENAKKSREYLKSIGY